MSAEPVRPEAPKRRVIRDKAFSKRLETACEAHPLCPTDEYRGKQKWIYDNLEAQFGIKVSAEAVRKWFNGETRPRPKVMSALARLLEVDEGWLSLGIKPDFTPAEKKVRNALAAGSTNLMAGFMQMAGGNIAYPEQPEDFDLFAIIAGKQHKIEVKVASDLGQGKLRFILSQGAPRHTTIGMVSGETPFSVRFIRLTANAIERHGEQRGDYWELVVEERGKWFKVGRDPVPEIFNMRELDGVVPEFVNS